MNTTADTLAKIATVDDQGQVKIATPMLDPIIHTDEHLFCSDSMCPCQDQRERQRNNLPLNGNRGFSLLR